MSPSWTRFFTSSLILGLVVTYPLITWAQLATETTNGIDQAIKQESFDPNLVLDDQDIFEIGTMNLDDIQLFLRVKGPLGRLRLADIDGVEKSPAEIIWRVANAYKINPKYLMALLQKEQSLVEGPPPTQRRLDWATGYGVCDDCSKDDPRIQDFKGFASQLEWAAKQHREKYFIQILTKGATIAGQAPGKTVTIDGRRVTPANNATAMLYSYTPHIHGNQNLWAIWQRWYALSFPEGAIVRGKSSNTVYLLRLGQKRPITSTAVVTSLIDASKIVTVEDTKLSSYRLGTAITFPNYSLVSTNNNTYLLVGTKKRLISRNAFARFGFNEDEVIEATTGELLSYEDGPDITSKTTYPTGLLVKDPKGAYWYIESNVRRPIPDKTFLGLYFKQRLAKTWTQKQLDTVPLGSPYQLQDGELVQSKGNTAVYVIENGQRRAFLSGTDFEELGYAWKNVILLPAKLLTNYPLGAPVDPHPSTQALLETLETETLPLLTQVIAASSDTALSASTILSP